MISSETRDLYLFDTEGGNVKLTKKNVRLAESIFNILNKNSSLSKDFDALKADFSYETLNQVCKTINSENSTHLRDYEREHICRLILSKCENIEDFKNKLKDKSYSLISDIRALKDHVVRVGKENKKIRDNYSFATKLCHYACYSLFDDDTNRDLYPIYDSVLSDYVTKSPEYKKSTDKNINNYKVYVEIIDKIIRGKDISRNGFDHLIWLANR